MSEKLVITIMAAGEGKRMNSHIPKVLHDFKGIPMLIRIIEESLKINPFKIIIITGKHDELIKSTVFTYFNNNNDNNCINKLTFVKQDIPNGTGNAIKSVLGYYNDDEKVLILNGDMPLIKSDLLRKFIDCNSNLLIAKLENPFGYGRIINDAQNNNKFIAIREQKDCSTEEKEIKEVNVGIYLFNGRILKKYIPMIQNNNAQKEYYLTDIIEILINNEMEIKTYLINRDDTYMIQGVNTKKELEELEKNFE